jgi:hypothetical protein
MPRLNEHTMKCSIDFKIECVQFVIISKHVNENVKSGETVSKILFLIVQCFY